MIMRNKKIMLSVVLCMIMLINIISYQPVFATQIEKIYISECFESDSLEEHLEKVNIPEAININNVKENDYICRYYDKEDDLNTVVLGSADGSETTYLFNEPIKYIDKNGNIKDKSNKLYNISQDNISKELKYQDFIQNYSYVNLDNDVRTFFPENLSKDNGIIINSENIDISMYPISQISSTVYTDDNIVYYEDVFGEFSLLKYQTLFNGLKEDIILERHTGNLFKFVIDIGDCEPILENNTIKIISEDNLIVATINPIYVYSSSKHEPQFTYNNSYIIEKQNNGKFGITVCVDEQFLENPETVYPVHIDPTITINSNGSGTNKTILDTPIYNGSSGLNQSAGNNSLALIGYVDSSYGAGRLLIKFPGLMNKAFMNSNYTIINAKLYFLEVSGQTTKGSIVAYQYTGPDWDETTTYSYSIWNGVGDHIDWKRFSYPNHTTEFFNILSAVNNWKSTPSLGNKGLIILNTSSESDYSKTKAFYTSEGVTTPYISVTYFYNGVKGVRNVPNTTYANCQSYAFWLTPYYGENVFPQFTYNDMLYCIENGVELALERTELRMNTWLNDKFPNKHRKVNGYDSQLYSNEWLVAMRVGVGDYNNDGNIDFDYHFWYRANDGKWYNKHGLAGNSEMVSGNVLNPSTANYSNGWKLNGITNYYSSNTIYYAIEQ